MTEPQPIVSVTSLTREVDGRLILHDVNFNVLSGEIFGIVGPNGAGKTTTLRILAGIITKYEGSVTIHGNTPRRAKEQGLISYMPEDSFPYDRLTGLENLEFYAKLYAGGQKERIEEFIERGIKIASLGQRIYDKVSGYSRGMKRRLLIARTLMVHPVVAILDEPTSSLDVESAVRIRNTIRSMSGKSTVILSSHNLLEVEYLCDRVMMLNMGRQIIIGKPREIVELTRARNLEESFLKLIGEGNDK